MSSIDVFINTLSWNSVNASCSILIYRLTCQSTPNEIVGSIFPSDNHFVIFQALLNHLSTEPMPSSGSGKVSSTRSWAGSRRRRNSASSQIQTARSFLLALTKRSFVFCTWSQSWLAEGVYLSTSCPSIRNPPWGIHRRKLAWWLFPCCTNSQYHF